MVAARINGLPQPSADPKYSPMKPTILGRRLSASASQVPYTSRKSMSIPLAVLNFSDTDSARKAYDFLQSMNTSMRRGSQMGTRLLCFVCFFVLTVRWHLLLVLITHAWYQRVLECANVWGFLVQGFSCSLSLPLLGYT